MSTHVIKGSCQNLVVIVYYPSPNMHHIIDKK